MREEVDQLHVFSAATTKALDTVIKRQQANEVACDLALASLVELLAHPLKQVAAAYHIELKRTSERFSEGSEAHKGVAECLDRMAAVIAQIPDPNES